MYFLIILAVCAGLWVRFFDYYIYTGVNIEVAVVRVTQRLERYSSDYKQVVVRMHDGNKKHFSVPSASLVNSGGKIKLGVFKSKTLGRIKHRVIL